MRVRFPKATYSLRPDQLVLATAEQAAQWEALKPELDAKAAAHAALLVVGAVVTYVGACFADLPAGTVHVGEIVEIRDDGRRLVRYPAVSIQSTVGELSLATAEQAAQWELTKAELAAKAAGPCGGA